MSLTNPSPPAINCLVLSCLSNESTISRFSTSEKLEISFKSTSVAWEAKGDNKPIAAGATSKRWKSFIKFLTQNLSTL